MSTAAIIMISVAAVICGLIVVILLGAMWVAKRADRIAEEDEEFLRASNDLDYEFQREQWKKWPKLREENIRRQINAQQGVRAQVGSDMDFDSTGFALGLATGVPVSPSQGISSGAMLGAALHQNPAPAPAAVDPTPAPAPLCQDTSTSSSPSFDSGSSSSSSCDSGSSF